jgi:hypothetical protein
MEMIGCGAAEVAVEIQEGIRGPDFHILPSFLCPQRLSMSTELYELIGIFNKRLTVIGERQRDESAAGQPAAHDTE